MPRRCPCCTLTVECGSTPIPGASVTLSNGAAYSATKTTNSSGQVTFKVPSNGTYSYSMTSSTCDASGTITVSCGGAFVIQCSAPQFCVTGCPSGSALAGATVALKSGATTIGTCTTVLSGGSACCSIGIPGPGSYEVIVSATGYVTFDANRSLTCGQAVNIALQPNTVSPTLTFAVYGCCSLVLPGATVTLTDASGNAFTCTTNSSGVCSFTVAAGGTYTYSISKSRFATSTGSVSITACATSTTNETVTLSPASGYACGPKQDHLGNPRPDPISTTLDLTDSTYGATTLTYDSVNQWWYGELTASFPGGCGCPSSSFTLGYSLFPCAGAIGGVMLTVNWTVCQWATCFAGEPTAAVQDCPSNSTSPGNPCMGEPNGTTRFVNCNATNPDVIAGDQAGTPEYILTNPSPSTGDSWTIASGVPFDLVADVAACDCATGGAGWFCGNGNLPVGSVRFPYNSAGTITVTDP